MNKKPILVILRQLPPPVVAMLSQHFEVRFETTDYKERTFNPTLYKEAKILVSTALDAVPTHFIKQLPDSIKLIANIGIGINHIDVAQATNKGIIVTNTPGAMNDEVANLTIAFILNLFRKLRKSENWVRNGNWDEKINPDLIGTSLTGKKLGLIGFGGIGKEVARRAKSLKLKVSYYKPKPLAEGSDAHGATYEPNLGQLIAASDIISLHCPLTPETKQLIDTARLQQMKNSAILVNTGRGGLIDENALIQAIENEEIAGAGLDVFEREPNVSLRLRQLDNVMLTPHIGSATNECRQQVFQMALGNVQRFLQEGKVNNQVV